VEPFADAAALLKERGAYKVYVMVTHGILSGDCVRLIEDSDIDEVINPSIISTDDIQCR
jgi:ribose-phosphate pyrophosphokinase